MALPTSKFPTVRMSRMTSTRRLRNSLAAARWCASSSTTNPSRDRTKTRSDERFSWRSMPSTSERWAATGASGMRLTRIEIEGFGSLQGLDLRFGPAMNLVVGPNEAGKSTLQEAIVTGLYGLQGNDRGRTAGPEAADRWRPWQGGGFAPSLESELDDGTHLLVERRSHADAGRVLAADR